jgi:hypothetical protein
MQRNLRVFADITKVDPDLRMVYGYASTTSLDSQNERISKAALEKALPDYMRFANIREMHNNSAVGIAKEADFDGKGIYIGAKVVDESAWLKVKEGVYKGFSIGGKSISKVNDEITDLKITEISLVDRPANPECVIDLFKAENSDQGNDDSMEKKDQPIRKAIAIKWTCGVVEKHEHPTQEHAELCIKSHLEKVEALEKAVAREDAEKKKEDDSENKDNSEKKKDKKKDKKKEDDDKDAKDKKTSENEKTDVSTNVKKGMYEVASLAQVLSQLDSLQQCAEWEAKNEQDNSIVPAQLKQNVKDLADTLRAMVAEETAEMTEDKESDEQDSGQTNVVMEMADKPTDIQKAGARHGKDDMARVQTLHDMALALGAVCPTPEWEGEAEKAQTVDLKKIDELNDILKSVSEENETLKKKVEELSNTVLPAKGATKAVAVAKEEDTGLSKSVTEEPKTVADIIKMKHQHGPDFLIGNVRKA